MQRTEKIKKIQNSACVEFKNAVLSLDLIHTNHRVAKLKFMNKTQKLWEKITKETEAEN